MLFIEEFNRWALNNEEEIDRLSFERWYDTSTQGQSLNARVFDIGYQIYQMQVCIDGILEDLDGNLP